MNRYLVIKDPETGKYFTNDYDLFWSRDLQDACLLVNDTEVQEKLQHWARADYDDPFKRMKFITIETIYKLL